MTHTSCCHWQTRYLPSMRGEGGGHILTGTGCCCCWQTRYLLRDEAGERVTSVGEIGSMEGGTGMHYYEVRVT